MTIEEIEDFLMSNADKLTLFATQRKISGPKIQKNLVRLANNEVPPPINVADDLIIEGHHRYIAGNIHGDIPMVVPGVKSRVTEKIEWKNVSVDKLDWDDPD